jgi:hypothetical protein
VRVWEAAPGDAALVDQRVEVAVRLGRAPSLPSLRDQIELLVREVRDRADVLRRVDDDLLPLEGRIQVRDDADAPRVAERERLRRGAVLAPRVEGARLELLGRRRLELGPAGAGPLRTAGCDDNEPSRERVLPELAAQRLSPCLSRKGVIRSIGAGKTIVVAWEDPSSSSVCR